MLHWRNALTMVFCLVAMAEGQSQRRVDEHSAGQEYFEFAEGHAYMGSDRIVWDHGKLVLIKRVADMTGRGTFHETSEKFDPPKEAWERFWAQMDTDGVWQWQANYSSAMSDMPDGSSWSLEVRHANQHVKSQGYNGVPAKYSEFRSAVYQLLEAGRRK